MSFETIQDVITFIKEEDVKFVDIRFTDVPGTEHHFSIPWASPLFAQATARAQSRRCYLPCSPI